MNDEQDSGDQAALHHSESYDDCNDEIMKEELRFQSDENPPLVAATLMTTEAIPTVVNDAQPVHDEIAVVHILDDGNHARVMGSDATTSTTVSQATSAWSTSILTQRTSSLTSAPNDESFQVPQEMVQIDAIEDSTVIPFDQSVTHQQHNQQAHDNSEEAKFNRMHLFCKVYLGVGLLMFICGTVGIVVMALNLGTFRESTPAVSNPAVPVSPSLAPFMISTSPSDMPSCTGLFSKESTIPVPQSGSDHFAMSDDGSTIVVANYHSTVDASFVETFRRMPQDEDGKWSMRRVESTQGYSLSDLCLSSDGSTLALGVNGYQQQEEAEGGLGGALLLMNLLDGATDWVMRHVLYTGGGSQGAVLQVASSADGKIIAFLASSNGTFFVEVYMDQMQSNQLMRLGSRMNNALFNANTIVELSGDGSKLFVVTSHNQVKGYTFTNDQWEQIGEAMVYNGVAPEVYTSFDGNVVALSSGYNFPVGVFEIFENNTAVSWLKVAELDIADSSQGQFTCMSADGRNVVVGELIENQQTLSRLFRRTGPIFSQVQDWTLPNGILRGMRMNPSGTQLFVAVGDEVSIYQKDCASGNR